MKWNSVQFADSVTKIDGRRQLIEELYKIDVHIVCVPYTVNLNLLCSFEYVS